jgi:hypothetical protein
MKTSPIMNSFAPAELIAEHNKIDDWLKAESKRFMEHCAPAKTRMEEIEQALHTMLLDLNAGNAEGKKASFSTDAGTAYLSTIVTPKVTDKEKYLDWCLDNWPKYGAMLQVGAPQKATLQEYQDENDGKLPPFVETSSFIRVNIRRT